MTGSVTKADKAAIEEAGLSLTVQQRQFVANLFTPGVTQEEAAVAAGYSKRSASVTASRLVRLDKVVHYIGVCVNNGVKLMAINAARVVNDLSTSANSPYVRLQAAQDILDRAGHRPVEGPKMMVGQLNVNIDLS